MRLSRTQHAVRQTFWMCALLVLSLVSAGMSPAFGPQEIAAPLLLKTEKTIGHEAELQRVLSVIERRTTDGKVLEKMQKKLVTLGERELHLAASLCERIARDDDSAGANIAFSIVTAMIVLL